jgi:serine/threonine protein kinase
LAAGRIVASKYCLLYEVGRGGMGSVWVAEHLTLRSQVAVKLIDGELTGTLDVVKRFEREARAAASLRSPHVVQVLDFGVDSGCPYLVMEFLGGESLGARLRRNSPLSPGEIWTVVSGIGRAMARAHAQEVIHRDLKPDNVFLVDDAGHFFVKVLDFGIAKALRSSRTLAATQLTHSGTLIGTPHYMSPEQAEGRSVDARSDLWSMAVITFECVTRELPFDGGSLPAIFRSICFDPIIVPSQIAPVPAGFDEWFARATARDPDRRFQSVAEFTAGLEPVLQQPRDAWVQDTSDGPTTRYTRPAPEPVTVVEAFPVDQPDRRADARFPSSIPAGINGRGDLRHVALVHNTSRSGALLVTRNAYAPHESLILALQLYGEHRGQEVAAEVVHVEPRSEDPIWRYNVGVRFKSPLQGPLMREIERRAREARDESRRVR